MRYKAAHKSKTLVTVGLSGDSSQQSSELVQDSLREALSLMTLCAEHCYLIV